MNSEDSKIQKENTIETRKYHPKVDISHYFGYGGHDIIASKILLNYIIDRVNTTSLDIKNTFNNISHEDIIKGFKNSSEFDITNFNFDNE